MERLICIGQIVKAHKLEGAFRCRLFSPLEVDENGQHRLLALKNIVLRPHAVMNENSDQLEVQIQDLEPFGIVTGEASYTEILLRATNWHSPEEVKPYHAWDIWVPESYAAPCAEGEFWFRDLMDCRIYCQGELLGQVVALWDGTAQTLLEVQPEKTLGSTKEATVLVPFHTSIFPQIEIEEKKLEVFDKEYFISLL